MVIRGIIVGDRYFKEVGDSSEITSSPNKFGIGEFSISEGLLKNYKYMQDTSVVNNNGILLHYEPNYNNQETIWVVFQKVG